MYAFKLLWNLHKWTGIVFAILIVHVAVTGTLLLIKKKAPWIQPPTLTGAPGGAGDFITVPALFAAVLGRGHEAFRTAEDIDRVDFQPSKRVFKVASVRDYAEIQVCAVTGAILGEGWRPSDLIEDLHDGSWFGEAVHAWPWLLIPAALLFLCGSGVWLWLAPALRRRRRRRLRR